MLLRIPDLLSPEQVKEGRQLPDSAEWIDGRGRQSPGRQARLWIKPIHTGEALGFFGQALATFAAASVCVLICTGFSLCWRRFRDRKQRTLLLQRLQTSLRLPGKIWNFTNQPNPKSC